MTPTRDTEVRYGQRRNALDAPSRSWLSEIRLTC